MRHARYMMVVSAMLFAGCGACEDEPEAEHEVVPGDVPPADTRLPTARGETDPRCVAFCRRSIECADAEGRPVPEDARDCAVSCAPGGTHHAAPESAWECADAPCGQAFQACTMRAMLDHMQQSEVAVFPRTCIGLCNKMLWCARRTAQGEVAEDCQAACAPGGAYASLEPREYGCVDVACGAELSRCREAGGPPPAAPSP